MSIAYDDQNVFAKILRGELPAARIYEDDHVIAIMDVMPQGKGHSLVIPKNPSRNILDISAHDLQNLIVAAQTIAKAAVKAFDADGVTMIHFGEPAGGQTVFHTHIHVIPRFDGIPLEKHSGQMADPDLLADHAYRIRAALGGSA